MKYILYKITNKINSKLYVGCHKTENIEDGYMGSGLLLKRAIKKHGIENFIKDVLFECSSEEEMYKKEAEIVNEDFLKKNVYNLKEGGNGGWKTVNKNGLNLYGKNGENGKKNLLPTAKIKDLLIKRGSWDKYKQSVSNGLKEKIQRDGHWWVGKKHKKSSKKKIGKASSINQKGKLNSQYGTCWIHSLKEKKSIRIKKEDVNKFIVDGWIKGRKMFFE